MHCTTDIYAVKVPANLHTLFMTRKHSVLCGVQTYTISLPAPQLCPLMSPVLDIASSAGVR